jgi:hypothetical protein
VGVPRWIDYLPDGAPLAERGFHPRLQFKAAPDGCGGDHGDLLSAAPDRLRQSN